MLTPQLLAEALTGQGINILKEQSKEALHQNRDFVLLNKRQLKEEVGYLMNILNPKHGWATELILVYRS